MGGWCTLPWAQTGGWGTILSAQSKQCEIIIIFTIITKTVTLLRTHSKMTWTIECSLLIALLTKQEKSSAM